MKLTFFAISMPSKIQGKDGLEEIYGERTSGYEGFPFWNRDKFCYEALDYLDHGEYEKSVEAFTSELEECESYDQDKWFRKIALVNRAKALEKLERWEEAIRDLSEVVEYFKPAFDMVTGWCKNCNDSCALDYSKEEYDIIDICMKAGYWPYEVTNKGYVYVKRKWHLEPGNIKNTDFKDLPDNWCCPYCGAPKQDFITQKVQKKEALEQAMIYKKRGELYQKIGKREQARADFDMAKSLDATLLS